MSSAAGGPGQVEIPLASDLRERGATCGGELKRWLHGLGDSIRDACMEGGEYETRKALPGKLPSGAIGDESSGFVGAAMQVLDELGYRADVELSRPSALARLFGGKPEPVALAVMWGDPRPASNGFDDIWADTPCGILRAGTAKRYADDVNAKADKIVAKIVKKIEDAEKNGESDAHYHDWDKDCSYDTAHVVDRKLRKAGYYVDRDLWHDGSYSWDVSWK